MRLSQQEIKAFVDSINTYLALDKAELRLYGSRVSSSKKGGDIDILLVLPNQEVYREAKEKKIEILVAIKEKIGDQKIDFVIALHDEIFTDPFLDLIYPDSILLHRW